MKHIKRKFLRADQISDEVKEVFDSAQTDEKALEQIRADGTDNYTGWLQTTNGLLIQAFGYKSKDGEFMIPEPHPVVLYFNAAQTYLTRVDESRGKFFTALRSPQAFQQLDEFYNYFSLITLYTTFLYNSLEAFMNFTIPESYEHRRIKNDKTELLNKEQIQRYSSFEEKIKEVIPSAVGRKFHLENPSGYDMLLKLKNCRDEIIHTKTYATSNPNPYKTLFTKALDFDYKGAIFVVRDYINYYEPSLIEDCNCGGNH